MGILAVLALASGALERRRNSKTRFRLEIISAHAWRSGNGSPFLWPRNVAAGAAAVALGLGFGGCAAGEFGFRYGTVKL